jgi:atypical dual specificity phosphatase
MKASQILPQLFVGPCPTGIDDIEQLRNDHGITAILSLQTDGDLDRFDSDWSRIETGCRNLAVAARRIPVEAFHGKDGLVKLSQCVAATDELVREGHTLYVHCNLGEVRSPAAVVAYLVWRRGWSLSNAIEHLQRCHPCSPDIGAMLLVGSCRVAA